MKLAIILATAACCVAAPAAAQSVFDGTWKADPATAEFGGKPITRLLKGGQYTCSSCATPWTVRADGAVHPVKGDPYVDAVSVTVVSPTQVKFAYHKNGKLTEEDALSLSADGKLLTFKGTDMSGANGTPVNYETQQTRVSPAPPGAHGISGGWRNKSGGSISDAGLTISFKSSGDMLTMSYPTGEHVTAKFGGPAMPVSGDPGHSLVKLVRTSPASFTASTIRAGKVTSVATITVRPGGRVMTYANENRQNGSTARFTATKQ